MDEKFSIYKSYPSSTIDNNSWVESLNCEIYTSKRTVDDNNNIFSITSHVGSERCNKIVIEKNEEQSPHVHPKLPDYDNLVAKFNDLKGEYMYKNSTNHRSFSKWMRW